ncbi:MAG: GntR family transcriptional regulator [Hyphomicrobiales bacterium]|nr:MAG: GntR family transcriptional regulator [Hyphomicrobiales bacterium]
MPDAGNLIAARRRPALSPIERARTTTDEVEERLILAIATGDKAFGDRITEAEIAAALKVSRVPAREAMKNLLLRGVLVEGEQRGLRVSDYSEARVAELFELRLAIEKIIFQHALRDGRDRAPLLEALAPILDRMRSLSGSGDAVALSTVDLDFHRTVAHHSGNELAAQIWEGLAQHMFIVFCRDWSTASDRTGEVQLHETLVEFIRNGSLKDLEAVLKRHFSDPAHRS